jgi:hypothetical protein
MILYLKDSKDSSRKLLDLIRIFSNVVKDGLQEIPESDKWWRRHLSFPGNICLQLRDTSTLRQYTKRL